MNHQFIQTSSQQFGETLALIFSVLMIDHAGGQANGRSRRCAC